MNTSISEQPRLSTDDERLARAVLASAGDGADAILFSLLRGFENQAVILLDHLLHASQTMDVLEDRFHAGLALWGRRADKRGVQVFEKAVQRWTARMRWLSDTLTLRSLADWALGGGDYQIIIPSDSTWPNQIGDLALRTDWAPPPCLWVQGMPDALTACSAPVAIVGSRAVNTAGKTIAETLSSSVTSQGHTVVSGGAMGTDAVAHWAAVNQARSLNDERVGRTIAFFAGGLDKIGPSTNAQLFKAIVEHHGALVSEMPPGTAPEAHRFLMRNRLIAAFADSVVVVQARLRSGALNTANWANELNRQVWAVPGLPINADWSGCNRLIADNRAMLVTNPTDIQEICHAEHQLNVSSDNANTTDCAAQVPSQQHAPVTTDADPWNAPPKRASSRKSVQPTLSGQLPDRQTGPQLTPQQQEVIQAVKRCQRGGSATTPDNVLAMLNSLRPESRQPLLAADFSALLGHLELAGVLEQRHNTITILRR